MDRIIAACGNDCAVCLRYTAHPYEKSEEMLRHTAELWYKIGYRDHTVTNEEIACTGCKTENMCRYQIVTCCAEKGIRSCAECSEFICARLEKCLAVTESFMPACQSVCTKEEYEILRKAFFEKEKNLKQLRESAEE